MTAAGNQTHPLRCRGNCCCSATISTSAAVMLHGPASGSILQCQACQQPTICLLSLAKTACGLHVTQLQRRCQLTSASLLQD